MSLDRTTEPAAFRRYKGAELLPLDAVPLDEVDEVDEGPAYSDLFSGALLPSRPLDRGFISRLFFDSLAISAWREDGPARFSLRVHPSAGNLHPLESYLIAGPIRGLRPRPALYHYSPLDHGLEVRRELPSWEGGGIFIGLTAILWRTAWKYGERAFRLVHLDAGHALAAVTLAAAARGWTARRVEVADSALASLLGVADQEGLAAERPVALLALSPGTVRLPEPGDLPLLGRPTRVSRGCRELPGLEEMARAAAREGRPFRQAVHARRSRSDFAPDRGDLPAGLFRRLLARIQPDGASGLRLALLVHAVEGMEPGIYDAEAHLRTAGDFRDLAARIARGQLMAGRAACVAVFLADPSLADEDPRLYRRLHWEAGALGHLLYLEAEAAGLGASGIAGFHHGALLEPGLEILYMVAVGRRGDA